MCNKKSFVLLVCGLIVLLLGACDTLPNIEEPDETIQPAIQIEIPTIATEDIRADTTEPNQTNETPDDLLVTVTPYLYLDDDHYYEFGKIIDNEVYGIVEFLDENRILLSGMNIYIDNPDLLPAGLLPGQLIHVEIKLGSDGKYYIKEIEYLNHDLQDDSIVKQTLQPTTCSNGNDCQSYDSTDDSNDDVYDDSNDDVYDDDASDNHSDDNSIDDDNHEEEDDDDDSNDD